MTDTTDLKRDWWRLAMVFAAPQTLPAKTVKDIDEEEEREIQKWMDEHPQIRDTKGAE